MWELDQHLKQDLEQEEHTKSTVLNTLTDSAIRVSLTAVETSAGGGCLAASDTRPGAARNTQCYSNLKFLPLLLLLTMILAAAGSAAVQAAAETRPAAGGKHV